MKISIGADHAAFELKAALIEVLKAAGHEVTDHGTHALDSVDYPDFAKPVCEDVEAGRAHRGILMCYTGNGMAITANKFASIRAALVHHEVDARLARGHNDANVLVLSALHTPAKFAQIILEQFLATEFEGGRHARRVGKMACGSTC